MSMLADARKLAGQEADYVALHERRLRMLSEAAARAESPAAAATHDYARARSYVAQGRAEQAVSMLEERERQLPDAYDPPARLAEVLMTLERYEAALAALDRALAKAYGPRKLRYLELRTTLLEKLGRCEEVRETLRQAVRGHEALARGQADTKRLEDARQRYESAADRCPPQ